MSTFLGLLEEVPGIAIDRFDGDCLQSNFLFLSHCHADHMVGLSALTNLHIPIITSEISAVFLKHQFPGICDAIETIEIESPLELSYTWNEKKIQLIVTALSAKHCPGSVMFLFETPTQTILYTGDFRIQKSHFHQYDLLKNKQIDSIHLDSTFLSEKFNEFPTQRESIFEICSLIQEWLQLHSENKILIEMPAQYGVEYLFIAIEEKLKQKIYVTEKQWQKYIYLPAMDNCISSDASKCRIFTKFKSFNESSSFLCPLKRLRIIKPSAMFWKNWKRGESIVMQINDKNDYRVAYSNHCSCSELREFLEFTKPKRVSLNVVSDNRRQEYVECLKKIYTPKNEENLTLVSKKKKRPISFNGVCWIPNNTSDLAGRNNSSQIKLLPKRLKS